MTEVTVRLDPELIIAAAREIGMPDPASEQPAVLLRAVLHHLAGTSRRRAAADGGAAPKRAGRAWEKTCVDLAATAGYNWDQAPLRGSRDLLDVSGTLPDGLLIGCKATARGVSAAEKLSAAMDQAARALGNLAARGGGWADDVLPFQIIQRPSAAPGRAYAVTEYGWLLERWPPHRKAQP